MLNKCDRVTEGERKAAEAWLRTRASGPVIRTTGADIPMEFLAAITSGDPHTAPSPRGAPDHYLTSSGLDSCHARTRSARIALRAAFNELSPRVLRAKGFVVFARTGGQTPDVEPEWMVVQVSGRAVEIEPWRPAPGRSLPPPGIVFIGLDDLPAADELRTAMRRAPASEPGSMPPDHP